MPRAIDMRVVALGTFIFHMRRRNRDAAGFFFRRFVNLIKRDILRQALFRQHLRHRRRQGRFAMIDMPDGAHVDMRLGALKLRFRHPPALSCINLASHRNFISRYVLFYS